MKGGRVLATQIRPRVLSPPSDTIWGVVAATHTTPNTVDLKLNGSTVIATGIAYRSGYAPAVNDVVDVRVRGPLDFFVLGPRA